MDKNWGTVKLTQHFKLYLCPFLSCFGHFKHLLSLVKMIARLGIFFHTPFIKKLIFPMIPGSTKLKLMYLSFFALTWYWQLINKVKINLNKCWWIENDFTALWNILYCREHTSCFLITKLYQEQEEVIHD